jgi:hypothetical protein
MAGKCERIDLKQTNGFVLLASTCSIIFGLLPQAKRHTKVAVTTDFAVIQSEIY